MWERRKFRGIPGQAVANPVANSGEPPTHGNDHSIPADASELGKHHLTATGFLALKNPIVALNNDEILGSEVWGVHRPAVASPSNSQALPYPRLDRSTRKRCGETVDAEEAQPIELSLPGHPADHVPGHAGNAVVTHAPHDLIV